jgi:fibrillarin-like rRNA methylase
MKKVEKYKSIVQNNDPIINSFFVELQGKIKEKNLKNLKKLKSDFVNVTKTDLETIKKLFVAQSTYKENQETITMQLFSVSQIFRLLFYIRMHQLNFRTKYNTQFTIMEMF